MAGKPSAALVEAMKLVVAGMTPYAAAKRAQIGFNTIYRSWLYAMWKDSGKGADKAKLAELNRALDVTRPKPRVPKKPQRFKNTATVSH